MNITVISKSIKQVPHVFDFTKNDLVGEWPGMPKLDYDPFPDKDLKDIVRSEVIAQKLVLNAKLKGDVVEIRPGVSLKMDGHDFAVTSAKVAINTNDDMDCTSEIEGEHFLSPPEPMKLLAKLRGDEDIYFTRPQETAILTDITEELKKYLARHPEKLHDLSPRKFEELIADILKDFGFDTELTKATRDGGRDIYAFVKNAVTSFLMFVECKKWAPTNKVGIEIVQRVHGAAKVGGAHKSMIVTTSFFSLPAKQEHAKIATELELKDYNDLKEWLGRYGIR